MSFEMRREMRRAARMAMRGVPERLGMQFARGNIEMRAKPDGTGGTAFTWEGYATVFDAPFEMWDQDGEPFTELVAQGAASRTLNNPNLDVPFLIGHNSAGIPLARTKSGTMQLSQDSHGVLSYVPGMDGRREEVRALASAAERGDIDEMSLAFVCTNQKWDQNFEQRTILEMDLHRGDVCAVTHGANPATAGSRMFAAEQLSFRRPAAIGGPALLGRERRTPTAPYTAHSGEDNECPVCHSVNDDAAQFCDQCGHSMIPKSAFSNMARVEDMTQKCSSCRQANSSDAKFCGQCGHSLVMDPGHSTYRSDGRPVELRAAMSTADINDLPDSAFALIEPGGTKDSDGKTTPRNLRHYPVHDKAHADDAAARAAAQLGEGGDAAAIAKKALPAIHAAQKKFDGDKKSDGRPLEARASASEDLDVATTSDYDAAAAGHTQPCQTCASNGVSNGRLKHPVTGANGQVCPGCNGTGAVVTVDDSTGIPGDEQQLSALLLHERRMRELELEELARA